MAKTFFVTGTDTDVGKTFISCVLLELAKRKGMNCIGLKPVAAGAEETPQGLRNNDALALQRHASIYLEYTEINPICLKPAIAPHIAAADAGVLLSANNLSQHCLSIISAVSMRQQLDLVLIEGAGGWKVPINEEEDLSHLAIQLNIPVIMIVDMKLGCINHAKLTEESILAAGLDVAGWVANNTSPKSMLYLDENVNAISKIIPAPLLGKVDFIVSGDPGEAVSELHIGNLF